MGHLLHCPCVYFSEVDEGQEVKIGTQRITEVETTSDEGAVRVSEALAAAFGMLAKEHPGGPRFLALIEVAEEDTDLLLEATRVLPGISGECVDGGYPRPENVERVSSFGFAL